MSAVSLYLSFPRGRTGGVCGMSRTARPRRPAGKEDACIVIRKIQK